MAILHMIGGTERDLGGFVVRCVLPAPRRQRVAPGETDFIPLLQQ